MPDPLLEMTGISKSFGGTPVLQNVDFTAWPGEVHALVGENGAGKSTLMKILNGVYPRDAGSIRIAGQEAHVRSPHDAHVAGISMIFQEHTLAGTLTVAQNIFLGTEPMRGPGIVDNVKMNRRAQEVLEVRGLGDGKRYRNISFELHRGEVLGLGGLVGAGRTEIARGVFGLEPPVEGQVLLNGQPVRFQSPREAVAAGFGMLTEDRKTTGIFPDLSLAHNISIAALDRVMAGPALKLGGELAQCRELIRSLDIRARSEKQTIYRLSGGNQQKAIFARWLFAGSKVLLLDEPTQGVDLGARAEIYNLIKRIADRGAAVLMVSSDLPELLGISHRIGVMRNGEMAAML